jgi:hypothetical protein
MSANFYVKKYSPHTHPKKCIFLGAYGVEYNYI